VASLFQIQNVVCCCSLTSRQTFKRQRLVEYCSWVQGSVVPRAASNVVACSRHCSHPRIFQSGERLCYRIGKELVLPRRNALRGEWTAPVSSYLEKIRRNLGVGWRRIYEGKLQIKLNLYTRSIARDIVDRAGQRPEQCAVGPLVVGMAPIHFLLSLEESVSD
jgi:hypothetical protein